MSKNTVDKYSQDTDMFDHLRFPDAIAFDEAIKECNKDAYPVGNRKVTNKCYSLLWKAIFFPSSVHIGTLMIIEKLQTTLRSPSLVMLAADTYIDDNMGQIPFLCIKQNIPYIFIPNKVSLGQALNHYEEVVAVMITFNNDPGLSNEFESAYQRVRSQCYKKRLHHHQPDSSNDEDESDDEPPAMVSTAVATVPPGQIISPLLYDDDASSSSSDWITIACSTVSDGDDSDCGIDEDEFFEEDNSTFHEYIRLPSPTPAFPPSKLARLFEKNSNDSSSTNSGEKSPRPGPSREFPQPELPPVMVTQLKAETIFDIYESQRRCWPIEEGAGEGTSGTQEKSNQSPSVYLSQSQSQSQSAYYTPNEGVGSDSESDFEFDFDFED